MTLEDFFTLSEMKDGLSILGRVEELVSVMQQQKDCITSNIGDAARQWSTVANTLAITKNKDCLNYFIQLNGLCFFNQWLREAQKYDNDIGKNVAEELIEALLTSLERLPYEEAKSHDSEIEKTIEQLLGHESLTIKDRARILFDKWNHGRVNSVSHHDLENASTCQNDRSKPSINNNVIEQSSAGNDEGAYDEKSAQTESHHSNVTVCSESSRMQTTKEVEVSTACHIAPANSLNSTDANALLSNSFQENLSIAEDSSLCFSVRMASTSTGSSPGGGKRGDSDDQNDVSVSKDAADVAKVMEVDEEESSPRKSGQNDILCSNTSHTTTSASLPAQNDAMEPTATCNSEAKQCESCILEPTEPQQKSGCFDCGMAKHVKTTNELDLLSNGTKGYEELSSDRCMVRQVDDTETCCSRKETVGSASIIEELGGEADETKEVFVFPRDSPKQVETNETKKMNQTSGLELDEDFDPLAVARQVAIEVEREVVDYREPFCSSPETNSGETAGVGCHDSVQNKQDDPMNDELKGNRSPTGKDLSDCASSPKQESSRISDNAVTDPEGCKQDLETQNLSPVGQETPKNLEKNICDFDLNEDVCTEEFQCLTNPTPKVSVNVSAPIAVVAASKGAPGLPVAPLQFEGKLGWRGSAVTSAFRPASPRRIPDSEKTYSSASKPKVNFLEIDLNVAESEDDVAGNPVKQAPVSSGLPSGESSMEVSSKRAERLKLDLNRVGDEDVSLYPSSYWRINHQNGGDHCPSPASSASSRQPSMKDFDLNDNPSLLDASSLHNSNNLPLKLSGMNGSSKIDDPVITTMGSRMTVERKEYNSHTQQSFMVNDLTMDSRMASRLTLPYARVVPSAYAYNGFVPGPSMSISPAFYGPGSIQYMVDSRGTAIAPQVLGSPGFNSSSSVRPPFLSVTSASSSFDGVGTSRPGFDLNSTMTLESGSRVLFEEQSVKPSQPASSGLALKRKEPDSGWGPYPFGYERVTSWQ